MKAKNRRKNRTLAVESLESRKLLATASLSQGVLRIDGTSASDTIIVRQVNNRISIDNTGSFAMSAVKKVVVYGYGGNDVIRLDANTAAGQAVTLPSLVFGGDGADFIVGGNGNDELQGNNGNDTVYGLGGADLLFGQAGNDLLYGGLGNDELQGGAGHDELVGGSGNDELWGQDGNDWLWGDDGNDYVDGGNGLDVAYGGRGSDTFRNLADVAFFLTNPHLKSPVRGLGDLSSYGVQDNAV